MDVDGWVKGAVLISSDLWGKGGSRRFMYPQLPSWIVGGREGKKHAPTLFVVNLVQLGLTGPIRRATSHMRPSARDHYSSSTLIGGKGGAGPSSLRTTYCA
jgi:hypothetical protein